MMDISLHQLQFLLRELALEDDPEWAVQAALCIAQAAGGIDFGYRFAMDLGGARSLDLAVDLADLREGELLEVAGVDEALSALRPRLMRARAALITPQGAGHRLPWRRALASCYLASRELCPDEAADFVSQQLPVSNYLIQPVFDKLFALGLLDRPYQPVELIQSAELADVQVIARQVELLQHAARRAGIGLEVSMKPLSRSLGSAICEPTQAARQMQEAV